MFVLGVRIAGLIIRLRIISVNLHICHVKMILKIFKKSESIKFDKEFKVAFKKCKL